MPASTATNLALTAGYVVADVMTRRWVEARDPSESPVQRLAECGRRAHWRPVFSGVPWAEKWATVGARSCLHGLSAATPQAREALAAALADPAVLRSLSAVHRAHFERVAQAPLAGGD